MKTNNIDDTTLTELDHRGYLHCLYCGWVPGHAHGNQHSDEVTWSIFNQRIQQLRAVAGSCLAATMGTIAGGDYYCETAGTPGRRRHDDCHYGRR